jgi:outer membrane autotransporter protein
MTTMFSSTSRIALLAAGSLALAPLPALAGSFSISGTNTTAQTLQGTETGVIGADSQLNVTGTAITWNGNATGAGVVITNLGTVTGTTRGIDSANNVTGNITINNDVNGLISSTNDAIRINSPLASGSMVTITNSGTIRSATGQALDLRAVTNGYTFVTNNSTGTIDGQHDDGVRLGAGGRLANYGDVVGGSLNTVDTDVNKADGVDFGDDLGGTVDNYSGATITGSRHGVTAGQYINVTNYENASIVGLNGSGVGSDGTGVVWNYGTIEGRIDSVSANGDGDGVDIDLAGTVINYGTIKGLGAKGSKDGQLNKSEGVAMGGGTITNADADSLIYGKDNGILIDDGNDGSAVAATTITNHGSITGENGFGVKLVGEYGDIFYNYGSIVGGNGTAVDMGAGNDSFIRYNGSSVSGIVDGGTGSDQLAFGDSGSFNLDEVGNTKTYRNFEELYVAVSAGVTFTGSTDFAGSTRVSWGTLILDHADLGNSVVTLEGAAVYGDIRGTLRGNGTIGGLTNSGRALIAPGAAGEVGTLTVNGNAAFNELAEYEVTATAGGESDLIIVKGETTIDEDAKVLVDAVGADFTYGTRYTILTSEGGIDGTFGDIVSDLAFLTPTLSYDETTVYLMLNRNDVSFASIGATRNQRAVGGAVEAGGPGWKVYDTILVSTTDEAQRAFDLLSGEVHASVGAVLFSQNSLVTDTLVSRLRQAPVGTSGALAALNADGPATAYATKASEPAAFKALKAPPAPVGPVYATWAQGFGQWIDANSDGNAASVDGTVGGFLAGADVTMNNFTFGLAGGYSSADSDVDDRSSSVNADTVLIAAYAGASFDAFKVRGGGSYGWSSLDSHRTVVVGDVTEKPTASYDGSTASLFAEAAYVFQVANAALEPFAQIAWSRVETDGFTEKNAPITGLTSDGLDFDTTYTTLGARVATTFEMSGAAITPHASLAWRHAFDGVTPEMAMAFSATGAGFTVAGTPIAEDSLVVGAGLDVGISTGLTLNISYEGQFADETEYNAVKGGLVYKF